MTTPRADQSTAIRHALDISRDDSTRCGMDTRATSFEYDLGKYGHDEVVDLSGPFEPWEFDLYQRLLASINCEACLDEMQDQSLRAAGHDEGGHDH